MVQDTSIGNEQPEEAHGSSLDALSKLLNQKAYSIKFIEGVTRSVISFWQDEGILDDDRDEGQKWRRFNLITILWISIISELKAFGFSNPKTKLVREQLFDSSALDNKKRMPLIEHCIVEAITYSVPAFLIVDKEGQVEIADDQEYVEQLQAGEINSHIIININQAIRDNITPLYSKPNYSEIAGLTKEEIEVLSVVREKDFQSIKITKKNGEIDMIEGVERIEGERKIVDLLKQGKYQNIEVKQSNGKVVCINRTVRKKLK